MSVSKEVRVPFVDLKAQHRGLEPELKAVFAEILTTAYFIGGPKVRRFEEEFASFVGAPYAVGMSSGTSALELALKVAGVGLGDDVIIPANTFFATAEAVSNIGARPVFADVDPVTFHIDLESCARVITPQTRAIIPVHLYGWALDMNPIEAFAAKHNIQIIEDAAQAHGVGRGGRRVGSSGRLTCFSFYPGKNLGALGDAGAITTADPRLAQVLRDLRDHGSPTKYRHTMVGTNARLDAIQAAALSIKLPHLDQWNLARYQHAEAYIEGLKDSGVVTPFLPPQEQHNFHLFVVRTEKRDELRSYLADRGIETGIHYPTPVHLTEAYQSLGAPGEESLPTAERLASEIVSLPMFAELNSEQISYTVECIQEFCQSSQLRSKRLSCV
jgi:dTDP-4-amino-4,6-dideoxygalactose transaminase